MPEGIILWLAFQLVAPYDGIPALRSAFQFIHPLAQLFTVCRLIIRRGIPELPGIERVRVIRHDGLHIACITDKGEGSQDKDQMFHAAVHIPLYQTESISIPL